MSNLNKCLFIGRIGGDPEIRVVNADFKVANFSIATSEKWTDKQTGEKKEQTEWINCQANNKQADVIEKWVKKGDLIYIEGKFKTRSWEKDGVKHYATFIQVESLQMFPKPKETQAPDQSYESPVRNSGLPPSEMATQDQLPDDDIPF